MWRRFTEHRATPAPTPRLRVGAQVEPQSQTCFYEDAKAGDSVEATVLVYRGGKLDIKLRVRT